mgnify:CR=1 FL=1
MIDVLTALNRSNVKYVTRGKNVAQGHVNIPCPFCGDDPSEHLGINTTTGAWSCWRNYEHRGNKLHNLLAPLLGISKKDAASLVGESIDTSKDSLSKMMLKVQNTMSKKDIVYPEYPAEFKTLKTKARTTRKFCDYLVWRGFKKHEIPMLVGIYNIKYALTGKWKDRIVFPIIYNNRLVSWTARTIRTDDDTRYKVLTTNPDAVEYGEPYTSIRSTDMLYNFDNAKNGGSVLYIVEGPLDCIKLDFYGKEYGVRAVALMTKNLSDRQINKIYRLADRFTKINIMLDKGERVSAMGIVKQLAGLNVSVSEPPGLYKDAGEMTSEDIITLVKNDKTG